jgi:hypothetical protein
MCVMKFSKVESIWHLNDRRYLHFPSAGYYIDFNFGTCGATKCKVWEQNLLKSTFRKALNCNTFTQNSLWQFRTVGNTELAQIVSCSGFWIRTRFPFKYFLLQDNHFSICVRRPQRSFRTAQLCRLGQSCQIFLGATYQKGQILPYIWPQTMYEQNNYQIDKNIPKFPILRHSKMY